MLIGKSPGSYPYGVEYNPTCPRSVVVWEGRGGQELISATLSLEEALHERFRKYFTESGSLWFLELIPEMINGAVFTSDELRARKANAPGPILPLMTPSVINLVAPSCYRRESTSSPGDRVQRFMRDYACNEKHAVEIISTMDMLSMGCFQAMRAALHSNKSEADAAARFFDITFPGLSEEAKAEITRYASWCVSK